jgi:uncharacterized protein YbcC (UPF0753/DUF2309 family)
MNAPLETPVRDAAQLADQVATACARIAPTWPLDEFIAVNPYWGWLDHPIARASAALGELSGTRLTFPRAWFRAQWAAGRLTREHLDIAAAAAASPITANDLIAALEDTGAEPMVPAGPPLMPALRDAAGAPAPFTWHDLVVHQISQHCAASFDALQASWRAGAGAGLYARWLDQVAADRALPWSQGRRALVGQVAAMPRDPQALVASALQALGIPAAGRTPYLTALLLSINGWAAWCAWERWQARLTGGDDDRIVELLAIRLAWEWLLQADAPPGVVPADWADRWAVFESGAARREHEQRVDWLLQHAAEIAYQQPVARGLLASPQRPLPEAKVQAVFCIDVRSEVFRRALEATSPEVHTRGFAGFFGLPIAYSPLGSELTRPQLPGLLSPAACVTETAESPALGQVIAQRRRQALGWRQRWASFRTAPASGFSFVETCGLLYAPALLRDSLPTTATPARWEDTGLPAGAARTMRPRLPQAEADPGAAADLAAGILGAMGLRRDFAPLVLLAGHGSQSANNPHAAGLDCGACGGQTGEVNARALADLLNDPAVREALRARNIDIPAGTYFVPGLHNTTTDDVVLYDLDRVPATHAAAIGELRAWLAQAAARARRERAPSLGLAALQDQPEALGRSVRERANDWAQVRPEWGLANNACFIVAPRERTRHLDLGGRSFLHDYDWREDPTLGVLELIMTAPMVVTNWINLQYHASTVDNRRYGSGNKVLHNVVGGRIGVFEGNGGDLRIGLPMQSLHDGEDWRHTPLRLSVFIEAPRAAIEAIVARHAVVQQLIDHGWLHVLRIDPDQGLVEQIHHGRWRVAASREAAGQPG